MLLPGFLAVMLAAAGCGGDPDADQNNMVVGDGKPFRDAGPGPGRGPGPGSDANVSPTSIRGIMIKLTKGQQSLTPLIGEELKADPPAWDTIQPQTKEYARLAALLGENDPPKGSQESWEKLTSAYTESAKELDKAAQAKDKAAALAAHTKLTNSCNGCHAQHRGMPGRGGMMMPPGGFGGPGRGRGGPPAAAGEGPPPGGAPPPSSGGATPSGSTGGTPSGASPPPLAPPTTKAAPR
jgi:hypothetical protein